MSGTIRYLEILRSAIAWQLIVYHTSGALERSQEGMCEQVMNYILRFFPKIWIFAKENRSIFPIEGTLWLCSACPALRCAARHAGCHIVIIIVIVNIISCFHCHYQHQVVRLSGCPDLVLIWPTLHTVISVVANVLMSLSKLFNWDHKCIYKIQSFQHYGRSRVKLPFTELDWSSGRYMCSSRVLSVPTLVR